MTKGFRDESSFGESQRCTVRFAGAAVPAKVQETLSGSQLSVFIIIALICFRLCNGLGRFQTSPGMFIPIKKKMCLIQHQKYLANNKLFQ